MSKGKWKPNNRKYTRRLSCKCEESLTLTGTAQGLVGGFTWWAKKHQGEGHEVAGLQKLLDEMHEKDSEVQRGG